jgi:hypothetical protein
MRKLRGFSNIFTAAKYRQAPKDMEKIMVARR